MSAHGPILAGRSCAACTLCCRLPEIDQFSKPANAWCVNCVAEKGCMIYENRPALCRDFLCLWLTSDALGDEWNPLRSHMMVYTQGPQFTILVDPDHPDIWRREPYRARLDQLASDAEAEGGYVIVFVGDEAIKIEPRMGAAPFPVTDR
jgi:hypothetical protein